MISLFNVGLAALLLIPSSHGAIVGLVDPDTQTITFEGSMARLSLGTNYR